MCLVVVELSEQGLALQSIVSHRWVVHPCSAYTGAGLDEGLGWLIKEVAGRLYWSGLSKPVDVGQRPSVAVTA